MNVEGLNRWLTLGANLGIVAGLVLVALQLEQAARYRDVDQTNAEVSLTVAMLQASTADALAEALARARVNAPDLTVEEATLVHQHLNSTFALEYLDSVQHGRGVGSAEGNGASAFAFVSFHLGNETALRWWELSTPVLRETLPDFVAAVDAEIARRGPALRTMHLDHARTMLRGALPATVIRERSSGITEERP